MNKGLIPLESIVRIVPGSVSIWDVAEQFVGVDCRLKAIFMLRETPMVAVESLESGQCCCFWASMVRTPEQIAAEERETFIFNAVLETDAETPVEWRKAVFGEMFDLGYRKQVTP